MGAKMEIGWTTPGVDGLKRHVIARRFGGKWGFFERPKRKGKDVKWLPMPAPSRADWLGLLEAISRRAARDLHPPSDVESVKRMIREEFPDCRLE